ncbi:MAG: hypothetical protein LBP50_01580, partial [Tannerella sp.]|nr:hypothetical protein [Tannerella sp.]
PREVYNGVNLSRFTPGDTSGRLREKYHLPDDVMPVGNIGRVLPWKNQYDYLRVAERLLQYHPKLHSGSRTSPVQRTAGAGKGQSPAGRSDLPFDR